MKSKIILTLILFTIITFMFGCNVVSDNDPLNQTNNNNSNTNRPPVIGQFYLSKYVAYTGEPVGIYFNYNDPDGDSVYLSIKIQKGNQYQYIISNATLPSTNSNYQFYIFYNGLYDVILEASDGKSKIAETNDILISDSTEYDMTIDLITYTSWYGSIYIYSYSQVGTVLKVIAPSSSIFVQVYGTSGFAPVIKVADYKGIIVRTIDQNSTGYGESGYASSTGYVHYVWIYDYWLTYSGYATVYISR